MFFQKYFRYFIIILFFWNSGCSTSIPGFPVKGSLNGQWLDTTVDSKIARYYLENYLNRQKSNPELDTLIDQIHQEYDEIPLNRESIKELSDKSSIDFAALYIAKRIFENEKNKPVQSAFDIELSKLKVSMDFRNVLSDPKYSRYAVLSVPGWDYKTSGHLTGADFKTPRRLLSESGIQNYLIEIDENGSIEDNAHFIEREIVRYSKEHDRLILAGASSAGPAIAQALSDNFIKGEGNNIKAWLNISGILNGTPVVDKYSHWPNRLLLGLFALVKGWDAENIISMSAEKSRKRFNRLNIPKNILIVNYIGLPMSGNIMERGHGFYSLLRKEGPNDGFTLITDIIAPNSSTIISLGADHFIADDPEIELITIVLAKVLIDQIDIK